MSKKKTYEEYNAIIYTNIFHVGETEEVSMFYPSRTIATDEAELKERLKLICKSLTLKAQLELKRDDVWFDYMLFHHKDTPNLLKQLDELFRDGDSNYRYH